MSANWKEFFPADSDDSADDDIKPEDLIKNQNCQETTLETSDAADDGRSEKVIASPKVSEPLHPDSRQYSSKDVRVFPNLDIQGKKKSTHVCPSISYDKYKLLDSMITNRCSLLERLPAKIISISYKNKNAELEIIMNSDKSSSNDFMNKFYEFIKDWEATVLKLSEDQVDYLNSYPEYLKTYGINRLGVDVYGIMYRRDGKYCLTVTSNGGISLAKHKLEKEIFSHVKKLSRDEEPILSTEVWKEFEKRNRKDLLLVRVRQGGGNHPSRIAVTGKCDSVSEYKSSLDQFFKKNVRVTKKISSCKGFVKLLQLSYKNILTSNNVDVKFERNSSIEISGLEELVMKKQREINDIIVNISQHFFEIEEAGLKAELFTKESNEARLLIDDVMKKNKCYIHVDERVMNKDPKTSFSLFKPTSWIPSLMDNIEKAVNSDGQKETQITIVKGSVVDFKSAEILVNSYCSKIYKNDVSKCGAITEAFLMSGGSQFQREFLHGYIPHKFGSDPKVTRAYGNLTAKYVFHSRVSKNRNETSFELMKRTILAVLTKAVELRCRSIAFPTMGCGNLNYSVPELSKCFLEAEQEVQNSKDLKIYICCYDWNLMKEFEECLSKRGKRPNQSFRQFPSKTDSYHNSPRRGFDWDTQNVQRVVGFTVFSTDRNSFPTVEKSIKNGAKNLCEEVKLRHEMVPYLHSLSADSQVKLSALPLSNFSRSIVDQNNKTELVLSGLKSEIYRIKDQICQILEEEKENRKNPEYVKKNFGIKDYLQLLAKSEDFTLPYYWKHYKRIEIGKDQGVRVSQLDHKSGIYKAIQDLVYKTWNQNKVGHGRDGVNLRHSTIQVTGISVVENPVLFRTYVHVQKNLSHKAATERHLQLKRPSGKVETTGVSNVLDKHLISEINECYLFHGTKKDVVENITNNGIDFRLSSDNAMFGKGAYFSESPTKADQYADDKDYRCQNGTTLTMLLSRVLLGDSFMCSKPHKFKRPPCIESHCRDNVSCQEGSHRTADSVVGTHRDDGSALNFREFIVYELGSSYPEFEIRYFRK